MHSTAKRIRTCATPYWGRGPEWLCGVMRGRLPPPYVHAMTTITPPRQPRTRSTPNPQRDFLDLSRRIKNSGLMDRRYGWDLGGGLMLAAGSAGAAVLLLTLGSSPWQLAVAALFGVLCTQAAFLGHDAAHQQVFATGRRNERLSQLIANLVVGLSHEWWARKHGKHHANPNQLGKDGDIATGALVFDPDDVRARTGLTGWITRRQGELLFPMLMLEGLDLHGSAARTVRGPGRLRRRRLEACVRGIRLLGCPESVLAAAEPAMGLAFLAVQLVV